MANPGQGNPQAIVNHCNPPRRARAAPRTRHAQPADAARYAPAPASAPAPAPAPAPLRVGERVRLAGTGRYAGLAGTVVKRGRTRYQVATKAGLLSVAFTHCLPAPPE